MLRLLATTVALTFFAALAQAEPPPPEEDDFSRNGFYVGAYGVYGLNAYRDVGRDYAGAAGMNVRAGYRGYEWFAMEAVFEWIDRFESASPQTRARTLIGGVNAKAYPLRGRFQPYALIGINGYNVDSNDKVKNRDFSGTDWGFRFGGGIDIYAHRNWVIGLEASYVLGAGKLWEADYASFGAGLQYRF